MKKWGTVLMTVLVFLAGETTVVFALKPEENRATRERGKITFERSCMFCHGEEGKGDGPAGWFIGRYSAPHPRNFTVESFKLRSTISGELPTDQDLFRTVTQGIPGYMPSFNGLTEEERWEVITYVKSFNPAFKEGTPTPMPIPHPPFPSSDESIENGRALYLKYGCRGCHGDNGYGDGPESIKGNLKDARGLPIAAGNLTDRSALKNGSTPRDVYRSLMTGLDGSPMPSFADALNGKENEAWDLVYYILSLSADRGGLRW